MRELHESVNMNKFYFEYVNVSFYEYMHSKELFNELKDNRIRFSDALKKEEELLKKINEVKMGRKTPKEVIDNLEKFYKSREEVFNLFKDYSKLFFDAGYKAKQDETEQGGARLKILKPKQMLQRLPIALAQVKAGNNSESLLNEIRQIVYSLYQSKQITKKVYNNIIKSIQ